MRANNLSYNLNWRHYRRVPVKVLPYEKRSWVMDRGSLTKRLINASKGYFRVEISRQIWDLPNLDERKLLNIPEGQYALVREVSLLCHNQVWVKARSIIPRQTLTGQERQLAILGTRPLGAFLFRSRVMRRGPIEIARFKCSAEKNLAARRSIFYLHEKPILVSEFFMPQVFDVNKNT